MTKSPFPKIVEAVFANPNTLWEIILDVIAPRPTFYCRTILERNDIAEQLSVQLMKISVFYELMSEDPRVSSRVYTWQNPLLWIGIALLLFISFVLVPIVFRNSIVAMLCVIALLNSIPFLHVYQASKIRDALFAEKEQGDTPL